MGLRKKDKVVLHHIKQGRDDIQKITEATTLENHEVNYCFTKLEEHGLIEVKKPDGMVERVVDGQKRVFEAPKKAKLTEEGVQHDEDGDEITGYGDMSQDELSKKVRKLETRLDNLEDSLKAFKNQVGKKL